jgi:hypothetical protein
MCEKPETILENDRLFIPDRCVHPFEHGPAMSGRTTYFRIRNSRQRIPPVVVSTCFFILMATGFALSNRATGEEPKLEKSKQIGLFYPSRIQLPKDLLSFETGSEKDGGERLIFPIASYSISHYDGWQSYLLEIGQKGGDPSLPFKAPITQLGSGYEFRAMRDGYEQCQRLAKSLIPSLGEAKVRELAKQAYRPRPNPPPPLPHDVPQAR